MEKTKAPIKEEEKKKDDTARRLVAAAIETVQNWPKWKQEEYNTYFATAVGAKKY